MNMKKGLIALVLLSLLVLFIVGCKAPTDELKAEEQGQEATEQPSLTGEITEVDNLDTEISEDELEDIEGSLDEITW